MTPEDKARIPDYQITIDLARLHIKDYQNTGRESVFVADVIKLIAVAEGLAQKAKELELAITVMCDVIKEHDNE